MPFFYTHTPWTIFSDYKSILYHFRQDYSMLPFFFFYYWMHNSFDICTCRCDLFCRLDKSTILQFLVNVIFGMSFMFFNLLFKKITHIEMKLWGKATETAVDIKIPRGMSAVKFSVKLLPANIGCVNYSGLKFSPDFQNTEPAFWRSSTEVVVQH